MKRYYVYQFVLDDTILIDTKEKIFYFYKTNIYGQFYNLEEPEVLKIKGQRVNGLIRRLQNFPSMENTYVVDQYSYNYIMTDKQRNKCKYQLELRDKLIGESNNLREVLEIMCLYALNNNKPSPSEEMKKYYINKLPA